MPFPTSALVQSGHFKNIREIGQGACGRVYYAEDDRLQRAVAVKEVLPQNPHFYDVRTRFEKEARIHAQVQDPTIIAVYHLEEDSQTNELYLICEYANGGSLADYLKDHGKLTEEQAINIAIDICKALKTIWAEHIVHRDIKPSNIMLKLNAQGQISTAKLGDFGIAQDQRSGRTTIRQGASHPGTPLYMAPEQVNNANILDIRADIYALGIVLWEMLTCEDYKLLAHHGHQIDIQRYNPAASTTITEVITKATQDDPKQRYNTPQDMIDALVAILNGKPLSPRFILPPTIPAGQVAAVIGLPPIVPPPPPIRPLAHLRIGIAILTVAIFLGIIMFLVPGLFSKGDQNTSVAAVDTTILPTGSSNVGASGCIVPNMVGQSQAAAEELLIGKHLQPVKSSVYSQNVAANSVVSQEPSGGTTLSPCQGNVTIVVSLGSAPVTVTTVPLSTATSSPAPAPTVAPSTVVAEPPPPPSTVPPLTKVTIEANQGWNTTQYVIKRGDQVQIEYLSGLWTYWPGTIAPVDGMGTPSYICANVRPASSCVEQMPEVAKGALIARIGNGTPIYVGNHATFQAPDNGVLDLAMNGSRLPSDFTKGEGSLVVRITVTSQELSQPAASSLTNITIEANQGWNATQYVIKRGDQIQIEYSSGLWTYWPGTIAPFDGMGTPNYICANTRSASACVEPMPEVAKGALIARIGDGAPIYIGNHATFQATDSGVLSFSMNHSKLPSDFMKSEGSIIVRVVVTSQN